MAKIAPFNGLRPIPELAEKVAARPYDVLNSAEARKEAEGNEFSFLRITKPEIDCPEDMNIYDDAVYEKGRENLDAFIANGTLVEEDAPCLYIYRQIMPAGMIGPDELSQVGIVACSSIDDYFNDVIKKHEYTRPVKENDRIKHMATLGAHVGPVFITYPEVKDIDTIIADFISNFAPEYDFTAEDGIRHTVWVMENPETIVNICDLFEEQVPATYIADGHHRAASSAKVGKKLRDENPDHTGDEEYNHFLSVLFPADQLTIIDYNRVITDMNHLSPEELLEKIGEKFDIEDCGTEQVKPTKLHEFGMYIKGHWYKLTAKAGTYNDNDPIGVLDVTILSENILDPILDIKDQRTDSRIDFVGGIRGIGELEQRVNFGGMEIAFSLYPVSIQQLINIADSGNVMPPKSTWFEPKLRSGLVLHRF